ncbi:DUF4402 domain-containing protein [Novosphingobium sp. PASSN1]|uniref:DUF4402 domain-containing protein n=1 Tax=Novosphingobium sp. PASSN1 TaxID=2015561 RepID=UPI000BC9F88E|nr:DUF4402 domain-containing protein [Novosphingobium sp. PASSN1]OYU34918.1 MAG: hypothetical protein CFE35_13645 [Novosphingobium sp. PASSN1]
MTNRTRTLLKALAALAAMLALPGAALAAPGGSVTMNGSASATIITPISIVATAPLRFGVMAQPTAAGTVTVSTSGAVTTGGGMAGNTAIAQGTAGPQAGKFRVSGEPGRQFFVTLPLAATVTSSGSSMTINLFTVGALTGSPVGTLDIAVGGTLAVGAAQPIGTYNGTYQITASYN